MEKKKDFPSRKSYKCEVRTKNYKQQTRRVRELSVNVGLRS